MPKAHIVIFFWPPKKCVLNIMDTSARTQQVGGRSVAATRLGWMDSEPLFSVSTWTQAVGSDLAGVSDSEWTRDWPRREAAKLRHAGHAK